MWQKLGNKTVSSFRKLRISLWREINVSVHICKYYQLPILPKEFALSRNKMRIQAVEVGGNSKKEGSFHMETDRSAGAGGRYSR